MPAAKRHGALLSPLGLASGRWFGPAPAGIVQTAVSTEQIKSLLRHGGKSHRCANSQNRAPQAGVGFKRPRGVGRPLVSLGETDAECLQCFTQRQRWQGTDRERGPDRVIAYSFAPCRPVRPSPRPRYHSGSREGSAPRGCFPAGRILSRPSVPLPQGENHFRCIHRRQSLRRQHEDRDGAFHR